MRILNFFNNRSTLLSYRSNFTNLIQFTASQFNNLNYNRNNFNSSYVGFYTSSSQSIQTSLLNQSNNLTMSIDTQFITSNNIEKPDLDDREYKIVTLKNNLTVLLIHDAKTDKAAAALDVNIGAFSDYDHLPGLAHFCEHLLFMGTKKYPLENEYSTYLSNHGGHSNAYTAAEDTNYYFEVNQEHFEGALDRFAQFFISPLFDPSCKDREILAVDSENKKNLQNDLWRLYQLDKSTSNPIHPYHKFSTGNLQTLGEIPSSQGIDNRAELLKFYKESYSANLMKVALIGRESLEQLENWAVEKFSEIPNYNRSLPEFEDPVFTDNELQKLIKAKPVMSKNKLTISFVVPDHNVHWDVQSSHYFSHLIGHEGKGSLLAHLKEKGWANGLSAGAHTISKNNAIFGIDIDLTEIGLNNYEEVLKIAFQYIKLLQITKPQEWAYNELKEVSIMNFRFRQKSSPSASVSKYAKDLQQIDKYIPQKYIFSRTVMRRFDEDLIVEFGKKLTVENSRITLVSQNVETNLKEKWYGTDYSIEDLSTELIQNINELSLNDNLHLPTINDFIPTNFEVERQNIEEPIKKPVLLKNEENIRFWYKKDDQFWVPKGYIQLLLNLPVTVATPYNAVLTSLFTELFDDSLVDTSYNADLAGLSFSISTGKEGIVVEVSGYNEKSSVLLQTVLTEMFKFQPKEERFDVIKERFLRNYRNNGFKVPYTQITPVFSHLINEHSWEVDDKLTALLSINFNDLIAFLPSIFKQIFVEGLILGNFTKDEANQITELVESSIKASPLLKSQKIKARSYYLPDNKTFRFDKTLPDEKNTNSCIQYYVQVGQSNNRELYAKTELLANLIREPAFDVLRTKEQLGYIVFSGLIETRTTFGLRIIIQSERNAAYLESRIVEFLGTYLKTFEKLSIEEFNKNKVALIHNKLESLKNLSQENGKFIRAISNGYYDFLQNEKDADILSKLNKDEVLEFYKKFIVNGTSKLIVNLHAKNQTDDSVVEGFPTGDAILDAGSFKSRLFLTPSAIPVEDITLTNFSLKL